MKTDRFKTGCVFKYPFKWRYASGRDAEPKDRPVCMVLRVPHPSDIERIAIVPISDRAMAEDGLSVELPRVELVAAGLNSARRAFVHLNQVNFDRIDNSFSFNPNARILGRFSKSFIAQITRQLVANIKNKRVTTIDRS
jgi:hypothetical protein